MKKADVVKLLKLAEATNYSTYAPGTMAIGIIVPNWVVENVLVPVPGLRVILIRYDKIRLNKFA